MTKTKAKAKTIGDCQHDAVILAEMLNGIDLMSLEGSKFDGARCAVTVAALERANTLANDLDRLETLADKK